MRRLFAGILGIAAMAACIGGVEPLPLDITIQPPGSITTADSASFLVSAQGNSLIGIETEFGDGVTRTFPTSGARTATTTFRHRYTQRGTYEVTATVSDAVLGQKVATVRVNVQ
jgi:hypothetical protein